MAYGIHCFCLHSIGKNQSHILSLIAREVRKFSLPRRGNGTFIWLGFVSIVNSICEQMEKQNILFLLSKPCRLNQVWLEETSVAISESLPMKTTGRVKAKVVTLVKVLIRVYW